jgi:hypothetical protein
MCELYNIFKKPYNTQGNHKTRMRKITLTRATICFSSLLNIL